MADDYFAAMQRVEERLEILPPKTEEEKASTEQSRSDQVVKVREQMQVFQLIEKLKIPELCYEERLDIAVQLREVVGNTYFLEAGKAHEHAPPENNFKIL